MRRFGGIVAACGAVVVMGLVSTGPAFAESTFALTWGNPVPTPVEGLKEVTAAAAGAQHGVAIASGGSVYAWGPSTGIEATHLVEGLSGATAVAAGDSFSLALLENGTVKSWGWNYHGQLGTGSTEYSTSNQTPATVVGLEHVKAIAAGGHKALALLENGTVMAWGGGGGTGSEAENMSVPEPVSGLSGVKAIATGEKFSLALLENGTVESWGWTDAGELGNVPSEGLNRDLETPAAIPGLEGVKAVSAGGETATALLEDGTVKGWGEGSNDGLGLGASFVNRTPIAVKGLSGVAAIATGALPAPQNGSASPFTIALLEDGTVEALGGLQRGNGGSYNGGEPTTVCAAEGSTAIAAGAFPLAVGPVKPLCLEIEELAYNYARAGEAVTLKGQNLGEATSVLFGSAPASFSAGPNHTLNAVVPPGSGFVHVTASSSARSSLERETTLFAYAEPPMFGICGDNGTGSPRYGTRTCTTEPTPAGPFRWSPIFSGDFETSATTIKLETSSKVKLQCVAETGTGEYTGPKSLGDVVLTFTGCTGMSAKCTTPGQAEGVIQTAPLEGLLGTVTAGAKPIESTVGLELAGSSPSRMFAEFSCGSSTFALRGAAIAQVTANAEVGTAKSSEKGKNPSIRFVETKGRQNPRAFEGATPDPLEASVNGGAYVPMGIKGKVTVPRIEFSSVI